MHSSQNIPEVCLMNEDSVTGFHQDHHSHNMKERGNMHISHTANMPNIHDPQLTFKVK
jgi:hypothetical protein